MRHSIVLRAVLATLLATLFATQLEAHPRGGIRLIDVRAINFPEKGRIGTVAFEFLLDSRVDNRDLGVLVLPPGERIPQLLSRLDRQYVSAVTVLKHGASARVATKAAIGSDPKQQLIFTVLVISEKGAIIAAERHGVYLRVENGVYTRTPFDRLYLPTLDRRQSNKRKVARLSATQAPKAGERVIPLQLAPGLRPASFNERLLKLRELRIQRGRTGITKEPGRRGELRAPEILPTLRHAERGAAPIMNSPAGLWDSWSLVTPAHAATTYSIRGLFSYRGLDNNLHPGWNWLVRLWWQPSGGDWSFLGERYINADGTWQLDVSQAGYSGQNIQIDYRAGGYYLLPQDRDNNEYWWSDPLQTGIGTSFDIGHRVADTSPATGILPGLGDVYFSGLLFWNAFYFNGINPERASPIRLFFPNTWDDCGDGSGIPWSCASGTGDIWLIAAHNDDFTIQHELGHQLHDQYWGNALPPGAGGTHTLEGCFNTGLALTEGFANAAPFWVMNGADAAAPSIEGGFDIENPDPTIVCNGDTNETWVASTLWDLLDRHGDGTDNLWFNNPAEVFAIMLNAGVKNGIKNYRTDYRGAASPGHEPLIDNIYTNNTIPVP